MLSHMPVNHPLRPLYRFLAGVVGAYVLLFGIVGMIAANGHGFFEQADVVALGLRTNLAFAVASVVAGIVLLLAVVVGRNADSQVTFWGGLGFMVVGTAMLALLRSDLNVLNATMATVIVSFVIGTVLFTAGMYTKSSRQPATT
jgi:hypothetical protein